MESWFLAACETLPPAAKHSCRSGIGGCTLSVNLWKCLKSWRTSRRQPCGPTRILYPQSEFGLRGSPLPEIRRAQGAARIDKLRVAHSTARYGPRKRAGKIDVKQVSRKYA